MPPLDQKVVLKRVLTIAMIELAWKSALVLALALWLLWLFYDIFRTYREKVVRETLELAVDGINGDNGLDVPARPPVKLDESVPNSSMREEIDKYLSSDRVKAFNQEYKKQYDQMDNAEGIDRDPIDRSLFNGDEDEYVHKMPPPDPDDDRLNWRARDEVIKLGSNILTSRKMAIV